MVGIPSRHAARAVATPAGLPCRPQMLTLRLPERKPWPLPRPGTHTNRERRAGM
jgi:hypothetical protein